MPIRYIDLVKNLKEKRVLLRINLDFDPKKGSSQRIGRICKTIKFLLKKKAKVIIISSKGDFVKTKNPKNSLKSFVLPLEKEIKEKICFCDIKPSEKLNKFIAQNDSFNVFLLENLNFYPEDFENSRTFSKNLASMVNIFVNDDFSQLDLALASNTSIAEYIKCFAGFEIKEELQMLEKLIKPQKTAVLILGGDDIFDRLKFIKECGKSFDYILLGGVLANTFLAGRLYKIGSSKVEEAKLISVNKIFNEFKEKIVLPDDFVIGEKKSKSLSLAEIKEEDKNICNRPDAILDIGPKTILKFSKIIKTAKTILWNGPLGMYEDKRAIHGSKSIARVICQRSSGRAFGCAFGDDTLEVLEKTQMAKFMDHLSFGGNIVYKYLQKEKLIALEKMN